MEGFVKLYRKLLDNPIFQNEKYLKVFIWCLLKATYKEHTQSVGLQKVLLIPGQFIYGRLVASEELKIKQSTLNDIMTWLKGNNIIDIKSNNKFSVITIINWELYQSREEESDNKATTKATTIQQQSNTNKKYKELKEEKNIYSAFFDTIWLLYPNKKGKAKIKESKIIELHKIGLEEISNCIKRYIDAKPKWQEWQNGSTFFNSGYIDYLDKNYEGKEKSSNSEHIVSAPRKIKIIGMMGDR